MGSSVGTALAVAVTESRHAVADSLVRRALFASRAAELHPVSAMACCPETLHQQHDTVTLGCAATHPALFVPACVCREAHPDVFRPVPFYPEAVIEFTITPDMSTQHFHIPLLLNPYGYSTYRGS